MKKGKLVGKAQQRSRSPRNGGATGLRRPLAFVRAHLDVANTLALAGLLFAVGLARVEIVETRRAFSLSSLSTIRQDYAESVWQYYKWVFDNADLLGREDHVCAGDPIAIAHRVLTIEHLHNIDYACGLYLGDLLGEEAKTWFKSILTIDMETLMWSYTSAGRIETPDGSGIAWVLPGEESRDYPSTAKCVKELNIPLEPMSTGGG